MGTWELFQSVVFRQYNELESKNTSFQSVYYIVAMNYIRVSFHFYDLGKLLEVDLNS